jgi:hypothetical protein
VSAARQRFLGDVAGIRGALALDPLATGSGGAVDPPAIIVLRRGILIAAFIALETFIRARCVEVVSQLGNWSGSYDDFPAKFRDAALFGAVSNLQKYAQMLKRQGEDYNGEIASEISLLGQTGGPVYNFSRHIAGDYTGNVSVSSVKEMMAAFGVKDCWNEFRQIAAAIGYGVPSIEELLKSLATRRHRSAHVAGYAPTTNDTQHLADQLIALGACIDLALTSSTRRALAHWTEWRDDDVKWRANVRLFMVDEESGKFRLLAAGQSRALKVKPTIEDIRNAIPAAQPGQTLLIAQRDSRKVPISWWLGT